MTLLAKPSGISLRDHRQHVYDEAQRLLEKWPNLARKYQQLTGDDLEENLLHAAWWHDLGKAHDTWQSACRKDYQAYQDWLVAQGKSVDLVDPHVYKAYERYQRNQDQFVGKHIMQSRLRHEFASLHMLNERGHRLPKSVIAAIAAHHGKLGLRHEHRWKQDGAKEGEVGPFYPYFRKLNNESQLCAKRSPQRWEKLALERYRYSAVRALLQLADTRASRAESGEKLAPIEPFEVRVKYDTRRPVQEAALSVGDEPIAILRAPTGSGKTYASLLWAERHIKAGRADRLVIAMPTRFTSNALSIGLEANVGETGLYHSSAWFNRYGDTAGQAKSDATELHKLAQKLATPVTVCTIDHLLISLTGAKEVHHATYFFLANSAVVFDEADFYDPFVQANLTVLIRTLRLLKVPILIMSATVPNSARDLYEVDLPIISPEETEASAADPAATTTRRLRWVGPAEPPEDAKVVLDQMATQGHGIIYANTIARALAYYKWLNQHHPEVELFLYHSRFTEADKAKIEDRLLNALGKDAWKAGTARGIAILTQIGEMSVNISSSMMLTDLCPWDRLAQRIGRLSRFGLKDGDGMALVVEPIKDGVTYPAPYGSYERPDWIASEAFNQTLEDLKAWPTDPAEGFIYPDELVERVNRLYPEKPVFAGKDQSNRNKLIQLMQDNWLIVPDLKAEEESDVHVGETWKSRHIPPQVTVLTQVPPGNFERYEDYYAFMLEYGVSVPLYLRYKKENKPLIPHASWQVADEEVGIYYTDAYDPLTGLSFLYDPSFAKENNQL